MSDWQNRIVGSGEEAPDQLLANPRNFRRHPKHQQDALRGVLNEVGWVQEVIVNRTTGHLVDGHLRVELALRDGAESVPVKYVELTAAEEALVLATLDPIGALATADAATLKELLAEVETEDAAVLAMLDELASGAGVEVERAPLGDPDSVPEPPAKPTSKPGDLWLLGEHRVLCGDARSVDDIEAVLDSNDVALVMTDPPYGIDVVSGATIGGAKPFGSVGGNPMVAANRYAPIIGDSTTETAREAYHACVAVGARQFVIWGGNYFTDFLPPARCWLVWDKKGREWDDNFSDFEMAWTSLEKPSKLYRHTWMGMVQSGEREKRVHPTQKPAELIASIIRDVAPDDGAILDVFGGSGSTLMACERIGRRAAVLELEPRYVDVIVRRWEEYTGQTAVLDRKAAAA